MRLPLPFFTRTHGHTHERTNTIKQKILPTLTTCEKKLGREPGNEARLCIVQFKKITKLFFRDAVL